MQGLAFDDPAWRTTFPHRLVPRQDEWLASLLWRCDEANHWKSGTTVVHLLRAASKHGSTNRFNIMAPSWVHLTQLSQLLAIPTSSIVATTYQSELDRLSLVPHRLFLQANASFQFSLCPACVAEKRMLTRPLMLAHITICPEHHVTLQHACQCGARLRLFCRQAPPFTCSTCALDWGKLLPIQACPERIALEQQLLSYYAFFFSKGTPKLLVSTLRLIEEHEQERGSRRSLLEERQEWPVGPSVYRGIMSLGSVVYSLLRLNLSLHEVMTAADHTSGTRSSDRNVLITL